MISTHWRRAVNENIHLDDPTPDWARLVSRVDAQSWPAGCLYVVATPIGNLGDLTLRAWQALCRADVIAAEDTRSTRVLLDAWGVQTPLMASHRHNEAQAAAAIVERLRAGERVALVSDAGSPAVCDPGARVVASVIEAGFRVVPLPGASALICALMAAGVTDDMHPEFVFAGFAPAKSLARQKWFKRWLAQPHTLVFYETPHRIAASLKELAEIAGAERNVTLARELTKRFEQLCTMPLGQTADWIAADDHREQGEYVVILHPQLVNENQAGDESAALMAMDRWIDAMLPMLSVRDIAKIVAQATGFARDAVYARALGRKGG